MLRWVNVFVFGVFVALFSSISMSAVTDYSSITASIDYSTAIVAIMALGALIAAALGTVKGVKLLWKLL